MADAQHRTLPIGIHTTSCTDDGDMLEHPHAAHRLENKRCPHDLAKAFLEGELG